MIKDDLKVSRRKRLTTERLQTTLGVGHFTALQMVTDVVDEAPSLCQLPPSDLGSGVSLDKPFDADDCERLRRLLKMSSQFRCIVGFSVSPSKCGHLVCEARQYTIGGSNWRVKKKFVCSLNVKPLEPSLKPRWDKVCNELLDMSNT